MQNSRPFSTSKAKITDIPVPEVETLMNRCKVGRSLPQLISGDPDRFERILGQYKQSSNQIAGKSYALEKYRRQKQQVSATQQHQVVWEQQMHRMNETIERLDKELQAISEKYSLVSHESAGEDPGKAILQHTFDIHNSVKQLYHNPTTLRDSREVDSWLYTMYDLDLAIENALRDDNAAIEQLIRDSAGYRNQFSRRAQLTITPELPHDIQLANCVDSALKEDLIAQFIQTAEQFKLKISKVGQNNQSTEIHQLPGHYQELISYVHHIYSQQPTLYKTQMMLSRLRMEIQDISAEELQAHLEMHTINHWLQMKRESIHESWVRIRQEFIDRIRQSIEECNRGWAENQQHCASVEQLEKRRLECRLRLNQWRKEKYQQSMHEYEEQVEEQARLHARMERQQSKWAKERQIAKESIEEYRRQLAAVQQQVQELRRVQEQESALERAVESRRNKERVEYRREQLVVKQQQANAKQEEQRRQQESVRDMLNRLRQQVAVNVERDPKRLLNPTAASLQTKRTVDGTALFRVDGYQDCKVLRDPRLRLTMLLADRGLLHSEYARGVLASMPADRLPRRDSLPSK